MSEVEVRPGQLWSRNPARNGLFDSMPTCDRILILCVGPPSAHFGRLDHLDDYDYDERRDYVSYLNEDGEVRVVSLNEFKNLGQYLGTYELEAECVNAGSPVV